MSTITAKRRIEKLLEVKRHRKNKPFVAVYVDDDGLWRVGRNGDQLTREQADQLTEKAKRDEIVLFVVRYAAKSP